MSGPGSLIVAMLALFWGLVYLWFHFGFVAVMALGALCDLALSFAGRRRPGEIRRGKQS